MHLIGSQSSENGVSQDLHMFQPPGYGHRLIGNPKVNSWIGNSVFVTVWILTRSCCARASGHFGGLCVFDQFLRLDRHHHFKNAKGDPLEKQDLMFSPAKTFWRSFEERWSMRHVDSYRPNYRQSNTLLKRGCCWRFQRQMKVFKKVFSFAWIKSLEYKVIKNGNNNTFRINYKNRYLVFYSSRICLLLLC